MVSTPTLTPTSYAILGLLAIQPWSSYDLTQQMQRSLGRFWPRAESKLYEEPKKLVTYGLATRATEYVGRRQRTLYTITDTGRDRLAQWLDEPAQPPQLESESLLKVFLADQGTKEQLLKALASMRAWAEKRLNDDADIARSYLEETGKFPERMALLILIGRYSSDFAEMTRRWACWAEGIANDWPNQIRDMPVAWEELRQIADRPSNS